VTTAVRDRRPRVLVVAYDFPPHAAIGTMRTLRVVQQLHARGWEITVLTGDPAQYLPKTPVDPALLERVPADVRVIRAGAMRGLSRLEQRLRGKTEEATPRRETSENAAMPAKAPRRGVMASLARMKDTLDAALSIPDREIGWWLPALLRGTLDQLRHGRPDVIYSSAPPWTGQLVASGLQMLLRKPWVADCRDPWARAPWREDRKPFALRMAARLERHMVRRADRLVFVTQSNRDDFAATYGPAIASKLHVVTNGCDQTEFDGVQRSSTPDDPFVLLHAGSLYAGRTPVSILRAIAAAAQQGHIDLRRFRLRFLGSTGLRGADLAGICQQLGLQEVVEFVARVPRRQSVQAMVDASALLLLQPGHAVSVPGKLYEYMAAGRPILAIADEGETAELVRATGTGVSVTDADETAIVDALRAVMKLAASTTGRPAAELYDGMAKAMQTTALLEAIVDGRTAPAATRDVHVESSNRSI
jgi:glycosyltransferase involved in cell wall biosynthesis